MQKGRHIIYVDESTFNQWQVPTKAWVRNDSVVRMPSNRGKSVTVIGAISSKLGLVHALIFTGSNDSKTFREFTHQMIKKI